MSPNLRRRLRALDCQVRAGACVVCSGPLLQQYQVVFADDADVGRPQLCPGCGRDRRIVLHWPEALPD